MVNIIADKEGRHYLLEVDALRLCEVYLVEEVGGVAVIDIEQQSHHGIGHYIFIEWV